MDEWFWLVVGFIFGVMGSLFITILKYFLGARRDSKIYEREHQKKLKNITSLVLVDILNKLQLIEYCHDLYQSVLGHIHVEDQIKDEEFYFKIVDQISDNFEYYDENAYNTLLGHLIILPFKELESIIDFYTTSRSLSKGIKRDIKKRDIGSLRSKLMGISEVLLKAYFTLKLLFKNILKDPDKAQEYEDKANKFLIEQQNKFKKQREAKKKS